jgi:hypothetical protein
MPANRFMARSSGSPHFGCEVEVYLYLDYNLNGRMYYTMFCDKLQFPPGES